MGRGFSEEEINELKEQFELFDMMGDGHIPAKEIGLLVRSLGKCPTETELQEILKKVGAGNMVQFPEFLEVMGHRMKPVDPDHIVTSLRVFDKEGKGKIALSELRHILTQMGECLTDREVNEVMEEFPPDDKGMIKYEKFIAALVEQYVV